MTEIWKFDVCVLVNNLPLASIIGVLDLYESKGLSILTHLKAWRRFYKLLKVISESCTLTT